jgi:hypothetical protein
MSDEFIIPEASRKEVSNLSGGVKEAKPLPYDPPKGPKDQHHERPGLGGGDNHGCCGTQGKY